MLGHEPLVETNVSITKKCARSDCLTLGVHSSRVPTGNHCSVHLTRSVRRAAGFVQVRLWEVPPMTPPGTSAWITGTRKLCSMPESVGLPVVMGEIGGENRQASV